MRYAIVLVLLVILSAPGWAETAVIDTGEVYAYGHQLIAPYTLERTETRITINGIQVCPSVHEPDEQDRSHSSTPAKLTPRGEVEQQLREREAKLWKEGRSLEEITPAVVKMALEYALVDTITDVREASFFIWFTDDKDSDKREAQKFLVGPPSPKPSLASMLNEEFKLWTQSLNKGCLVIQSSNVRQSVLGNTATAQAVRDEIVVARSMTVAVIEATWASEKHYLWVSSAKEFAKPLPLELARGGN
ncbi:MAG: hypothetical protein KJ970_05585 [Candidatus Eisenbacteria bacterium]|uniref:Uncharacterized protein n=1 Tax=Eiseniibacteriota bacterium TaxID=2212470 RepID=A0A948RSV6_UNCEI|nr:hypothetical protein [Candidatus Eisenbacteria bacterium]MBU1947648.1 hypothetical protein [Candidatus Eisenbacteria bacterium]MBU2690380.1 hypothetical protein [Candidatus Eisenbacteria bacterium]